MDRWVLIFLGIFLLIFGLITVSNIRVDGMNTIMGLSALVAGIICIARVVMNAPPRT